MTPRQLHALTATVLTAYAVVHMANHVAALGGIATHLAFMETARSIYRLPAVEAILLGCVVTQLLSGLRLIACRWKKPHDTVSRVQALSGAYLLFFLGVHVTAVLVGRSSLGLDTNFHFAAAGFHVHPFQFFFAPYYLFGVLALFTHLGCAMYWRAQSAGRAASLYWLGIPIAIGALVGVIIVSALTGAFYPIDVPSEYRAPFSRVLDGP